MYMYTEHGTKSNTLGSLQVLMMCCIILVQAKKTIQLWVTIHGIQTTAWQNNENLIHWTHLAIYNNSIVIMKNGHFTYFPQKMLRKIQ